MKTLDIDIPDGYEIDRKNSTFERIVFKPLENRYPQTWEECIEKLNNEIDTYFWIEASCYISNINSSDISIGSENYNLLPSEKDAEKFLTLQKLYTCRQAYIKDWESDTNNSEQIKYCIFTQMSTVVVGECTNTCRIFSFPTKEMAHKFRINFKKDLEFIKDLL